MRGKNHTAALALAWALLAGVAHAQPRDVAKADALFKEGRALMKNGDYETACPKLEESYRLDPAAGTGINLGDCFEKRGKVASALIAYQAARALLQPGDPRIGPVDREIAALEKRTPRLTIKLARGAPEGTTVKRDGREVGADSLGLAVPVNPGEHWVTVIAPRRRDGRTRVHIAEAQGQVVEVQVGPRLEEAESPPDAKDERKAKPALRPEHEGPSDLPIVLGTVVALTGLGIGAANLIAAGEKNGDREALLRDLGGRGCKPAAPADGSTCDELKAADDEYRSRRDTGYVALIVGALAGTATLTYLFWPRGEPSGSTSASAVVGANRVGFAVSGSF